MKQVEIHLIGGQIITVNCRDVRITHDHLGGLARIEWYDANKTIHHMTTKDISAIVEV